MKREYTGLEIAIVGMAGRFPGADDVDGYWRIIAEGRDSIARDRTDDAYARRPGYVPAWGTLAGADRFDAGYFGYTPRDAALLDPQQRLLLETAVHTLEHAGYAGAGERVGVYAGTSFSTYLLRNLLASPAVTANAGYAEIMLANDKDSLATRISYHLDLRGPGITVQTACSTSLVAVHLACQALLARDCDLALAGGVSIPVPQRGYLAEPNGILSPEGRCRPFDATANGAVPGSGVAMVALKCLDDALRDHDTIHAVILGSAVGNDGGAKVGYTAPSIESQADTVRGAHRVADVDVDAIGYVETHGTGTPIGDPIEITALTRAFRAGTARRGYCALGSVKSLIGHLDAAAGIAGLIKTVLAMRHGVLPPSTYLGEVNPALNLPDSPFYLPVEPRPWPAGPRYAAVNSIGMGGTNVHVVLQEAPAAAPATPATRAWHVLPLSAKTPAARTAARQRMADHLAGESAPLADIAHTVQVGRRLLPYRAAVVGTDARAVAESLAHGGPDVWEQRQESRDVPVAFLFPGQGSQRPGMAREVYRDEPVFRASLDRIARMLGNDLLDVLYGDRGADLASTGHTQPALFAVEYALATLWMSWGIRPTAMIGHSVGEFVAACLAGTFTLDDAVALVAARGALMDRLPPGAMLAVGMAADDVELPDDVVLAADNGPRTCVVAGPPAGIEELADRLRQQGIPHRRLAVAHAFHSPAVAAVTDEFAELVADARPRPPTIPFVSNVTGRWITPDQATDPRYWAAQAMRPVRFRAGAALLCREPGRILLEVGPGHTLCKLVREQHAAADGHAIIPSLAEVNASDGDDRALASALAKVWLAGGTVDWAGYWAEPRPRVPLPGYPFQRDRHWIDAPTERPQPQPDKASEPTTADDGPVDDVTERIRLVWREMLGHDDFGPHDDFFDLGGHSLLAIRVTARLDEVFGVELPVDCLLDARTVAGLAHELSLRLGARESDDVRTG